MPKPSLSNNVKPVAHIYRPDLRRFTLQPLVPEMGPPTRREIQRSHRVWKLSTITRINWRRDTIWHRRILEVVAHRRCYRVIFNLRNASRTGFGACHYYRRFGRGISKCISRHDISGRSKSLHGFVSYVESRWPCRFYESRGFEVKLHRNPGFESCWQHCLKQHIRRSIGIDTTTHWRWHFVTILCTEFSCLTSSSRTALPTTTPRKGKDHVTTGRNSYSPRIIRHPGAS